MKHASWILFLFPMLAWAQAPSTVNENNMGVFTDTQLNQYVTSSVGGLDFTTEFQSAEGSHGTTEGVSAGVTVPSGASEIQASGLAGYAVSNTSTLTSLGFPTVTMGAYAQSHCTVNGAHCQGGDLVAFDNAGLTQHVVLTGLEVLAAPRNNTTAYDAVNGLNVILNGVAGQSYFPAMGCFTQNTATWSSCVFSRDGAAVVAFAAGALGTSGTVGSQALQFNSFNGGTELFTSISATPTGSLTMAPASGQSVNAPLVKLTPGVFSTLPTCASGTEGTQAAVTNATTTLGAPRSPGAGRSTCWRTATGRTGPCPESDEPWLGARAVILTRCPGFPTM
jgi:hypothetical protein